MVHIKSENGERAGDFEVLDQRKICGSIPRMTTGPWMDELRKRKIWVPDIEPESPVIELLIGSDYYGQILTGNRYELQNGLVALETKFGWTLSGKLIDSNFAMAVTTMHVQQAEVSELWDLERLGIQDPSEMKSKREQEEESKQHFLETVTRSQEGKYCVKLPWINSEPQIPSNKAIAESRLLAATRKLQGQGQFNKYNSIFESWITEGFIEPVHGAEIEKPCHYLPHRPVFKPNSLTTPVRPVLEHHLINVKGEALPIAGKLLKSLYGDNCVASVHNIQKYEEFREISTRLLAEAKMELRQWEYAPANFPNGQSGENSLSSVLGLTWNKKSDSLGCDLSLAEIPETVTKRKILSTTHKIFDPIGFTAPALIKPKLILQEARAADVDWDKELQEEMASKFLKWYEEVECLKQLSIPRCINPFRDKTLSIHCFCDASQDAYAAVLFLRSSSNENTTVRFLQAKARIALLKRIKDKNGVVVEKRTSIPRLELLACTIGARLTHATLMALKWGNVSCYFWSDSTTALSWIQRNDDWGTFVGNRVQEILGLSNPKDWRHVPGVCNPADLPLRGCSPRQLLESRWWEGPEWLLQPPEDWPVTDVIMDEDEVNSEKRKVTRTMARTTKYVWDKPKFSVYLKTVRLMGWMRRFFQNTQVPKGQRNLSTYFSIEEIRDAEKYVLRFVQSESFPKGKEDLKNLKVKIGENGLFRVSSKLLYKTDSMEFRSPIVLPKDHPIIEQLIHCIHVVNCHAGTQFVLGRLREKYWILQGRKTVAKVIRGWWERLIRSVKDLLRRMLGRAKLTFDELRTCLTAVESTINNRPLTTLTEDEDDLIPLTPAMFTRGLKSSDFPEGVNLTSRDLQLNYKKVQELKQGLQSRFRREYLGLLVQKSQEKGARIPQVGDVIFVGADNQKRFEWPMGRILELIPGRDGHVRVANVRTAAGILTRPLQRLYPLEISKISEDISLSAKIKQESKQAGEEICH